MLPRREGGEKTVAIKEESSRLVSTFSRRRFTVARIESATLTSQLEIRRLQQELQLLLEDADVGLLVDGSCLTQSVSSEFLGVLVGLAKQSRRAEKKFAVCNLSTLAKEGFDVANLGSAVASYGDPSSAIRELCGARKKIARRSAIPASRPLTRDWLLERIPDRKFLFALLAVVIGISAAITSSLIFRKGSDEPNRFQVEPGDQPFKSMIAGRVLFTLEGRELPDNDAVVIAWSDGDLERRVAAEDLLERSRIATEARARARLFVTTTNADGHYRLKVDGRGEETGLNVLVISRHVNRLPDEQPPMELLGKVLSKPERLLQGRRHHLGFVYVTKDLPAGLNVLFD